MILYTDTMNALTPEQFQERVVRVLKHVVHTSGLSAREVERRMGASPGYLSRMFRGKFDVKLPQLYGILQAVGLHPSEFFALVFPPGSQEPSKLLLEIMAITPQVRETFYGRQEKPLPAAELERRLSEAIRNVFAEAQGTRG